MFSAIKEILAKPYRQANEINRAVIKSWINEQKEILDYEAGFVVERDPVEIASTIKSLMKNRSVLDSLAKNAREACPATGTKQVGMNAVGVQNASGSD